MTENCCACQKFLSIDNDDSVSCEGCGKVTSCAECATCVFTYCSEDCQPLCVKCRAIPAACSICNCRGCVACMANICNMCNENDRTPTPYVCDACADLCTLCEEWTCKKHGYDVLRTGNSTEKSLICHNCLNKTVRAIKKRRLARKQQKASTPKPSAENSSSIPVTSDNVAK